MTEVLAYAFVPIAIGAVAVVLVLGLINMMRGGSPHKSQKLMRLRVLLQFIAIVITAGVAAQRGGRRIVEPNPTTGPIPTPPTIPDE